MKEFQLPQSGHRPSHFGEEYPQDWQANTDGILVIASSTEPAADGCDTADSSFSGSIPLKRNRANGRRYRDS
jgi:hypothetical protein